MFDLSLVLFSLWFLLPIGVANMTPVFLSRVSILQKYNVPIDMNKKFRGKRILGDHKTVIGLIGGILAAIIVVWLQQKISMENSFLLQIVPRDYSHANSWLLGFLCGFGALWGDSLKSFFKRQINIKPGMPFFPFDQLDYIFGAILITSFYLHVSLIVYLLLTIEGFFLHIVISFFGFFLKLKDTPI